MKRHRVQFTMRRMMIAVAVCAVAFAVISQPGPPRSVKATSSDPKVAIRQEKVLRGVLWGMSYDQAHERAQREGRPILIFFTGVNDSNSRMMEVGVFPRTDVVPHLSPFVTVMLFMDSCPIHSLTSDQRGKIAEENQEFQLALTNDPSTPLCVAVDPVGKLIAARGGYVKPGEFIAFLEAAESAYRMRSGADRYPSWPVWALGGFLVAVSCLIVIRARSRRERGVKNRDSVTSSRPDRREPGGKDACPFRTAVSGGEGSSEDRRRDGWPDCAGFVGRPGTRGRAGLSGCAESRRYW